MYNNSEKEPEVETKDLSPSIVSIEKRSKKIARVRLSVQGFYL